MLLIQVGRDGFEILTSLVLFRQIKYFRNGNETPIQLTLIFLKVK